jgi:hypothetical protein
MNDKLKDTLKVSMLSWFVLMSKDYYEKNDSDIAKLITTLDKYLNKRKRDIVSSTDERHLVKKISTIKDKFERLIVDEKYHDQLHLDKDLPTMNYSPTLLAIQCLDDLLLGGNTEFRVKFGHINTGQLLLQIEEYDGSLTMDSLKLYHKLKKEVGV